MSERKSGILLHITSLPAAYGIGDFGPEAYQFVDRLWAAKQSLWQILPLNLPNAATGSSPYSCISAFAGNIFLISPEKLMEEGLLAGADLKQKLTFSSARCEYDQVIAYKEKLFDKAFEKFLKKSKDTQGYEAFCVNNAAWLEDFVLFALIRKQHKGRSWNQWPQGLKDRKPQELQSLAKRHSAELEKERFLQFVFFKQWSALKSYANSKGIRIIGDLPIYVSYDSADVWANPEIFKLDEEGNPTFVAGVPPDYFSKTGQRWGNPVYRWDILESRGFDWWVERMRLNLALFDLVRIDHFRGLVAYWEIAAGERTAVNGKWAGVPTNEFFNTLLRNFPHLPVLAEDLGIITDDVRAAIARFHFPGMKVLLFAFNEDQPMHPYLPHTYNPHCVVYTGTHDNNTIKGWLDDEASEKDKQRLSEYTGRKIAADTVHWELIRLAMMSVANLVIIPAQDALGLGKEARMNTPSTTKGNWLWRMSKNAFDQTTITKLRRMSEVYGRA